MNRFYFLFAPNNEYNSTFHALFDRIEFIPYLTIIRDKELSIVFIPDSPFNKIDITLKAQFRKLHVSTGTAAVFTRIIYNFITRQLATLGES